ncbi:MAG: electron transfer flavoprotein subunit alpha/FixB family protein [Chitinophagales bacterium]|nr:electron transfer flavoprotein subunit alpha/FixB family protein [Chitinophagales bacterium]
MSVLIYIDQSNGEAKKASLEAAYYGSQVAAKEGGDAIGLFLGEGSGLESLGNYGLKKVLQVNNAAFNNFDSKAFTKVIAEAAESIGAKTVVIPFNQNGKSLAPRVSVKLKAGYVPGASTLVDNGTVTKSVFSGKAYATYGFNTDKKVIGLSANSIQVQKSDTTASVEAFNTSVSAGDFASKVLSVETVEGEVPLTEAEIVVSAGRGLKGPENWGMIEDLAHALGAATACSRPVSDIGWRPHHEHVGQTGATVKPNLYIAIGISGAIQHLAGVNQSKVMVVINNDPEAPFFKAADYGIVGDAFEVVPKLVEAVKQFKAQQS